MTMEEYAKRNHAKKVRQRYDMMVSEHRCTQCGRQDDRTLAGKTRCDVCYGKAYKSRNERSEQQRADEIRKHKEKRQERLDAKQCRECGKQDYLTLHGKQLCATCKRKCKERASRYVESGKCAANQMRRKEEFIANGKCVKCGRNEPEQGKKHCTDCLVRERIYKRKRRAIIKGLGV